MSEKFYFDNGDAKIATWIYFPSYELSLFGKEFNFKKKTKHAILYIHGFGKTHEEFFELFDEGLIDDYTLFLPDLRAHGETKGDLFIDKAVDDILILLQEARKYSPKIILGGHSLGAYLSFCAASRYDGEDIEKLFLLSGPHLPLRTIMRDYLKDSTKTYLGSEKIGDKLFDMACRSMEKCDKGSRVVKYIVKMVKKIIEKRADNFNPPGDYSTCFEMLKDIFESPGSVDMNFENIKYPVILIHGENDSVVPPYHSEVLAEKLKNAGKDARLYILPELDHSLVDERTGVVPKDKIRKLLEI